MRDRSEELRRAAGSRFTVDLVVVTAHAQRFFVHCTSRAGGKRGWELPWSAPRAGESLETTARRIARSTVHDIAWMEQIGAFAQGRRHPGAATLSVGFVALVPDAARQAVDADPDARWIPIEHLGSLTPRQRAMVDAAVSVLRTRMDQAPIPFRLLPDAFTLRDLQQIYELLLGRRLHKASFRRALHASWLVEPTDEWRSEGRGRPAQLFRFVPRKRRNQRRSVRFDLL